ncbi:HD domain-containing protein [Clostridium sp.]|uniref:HD domain-containing protein n=1 Tax=Clostridium sp. TaxID=1506 RepID=UPI00290983A8|nr:HD domain-containing protein [Clostridium sp.]MDU5108273.1 HD domain-containing protein [Clostridium sp.]
MFPKREKAIEILEESNLLNPGPWKDHSIVVAECAYKIASKCDDMDEEKAYVLGLLHDVGRRFGVTYIAHVIDGYNYLMEFGYDEAARICMTHSFQLKDINEYIGEIDISYSDKEKIINLLNGYEYDDYDRLIQLCDSISMPTGPVDIAIRMNDVKTRYGYYPQDKWNKNIELKKYFEDKVGGLEIC